MLTKNDGKISSASDRRNEDLVGRYSSNGFKSLGKTNNMSSGKANGGSTLKRELPEKANGGGSTVKRELPEKANGGGSTVKRELPEKANGGGSTVKKELPEKANGGSGVKRESSEKTNGPTAVKKDGADVKKEATSSGSKLIVKKTSTTKVLTKEEKKKVFTLPGQKHEPPEEREPLRIFYESLHEQRPDSEMAEFWMMEHGLLSPERAKKAFEKKQKRGSTSFGTPVKSSTPSKDYSSKVVARTSASNGKQSASKVPEQKGKRKWVHDDSDDDLLIARPLKRKLKT